MISLRIVTPNHVTWFKSSLIYDCLRIWYFDKFISGSNNEEGFRSGWSYMVYGGQETPQTALFRHSSQLGSARCVTQEEVCPSFNSLVEGVQDSVHAKPTFFASFS